MSTSNASPGRAGRGVGAILFWSGLAAMTAGALAGPLDPPDGPISPTYRTLSEVEPRVPIRTLPADADSMHVISQPGSYYLDGDVLAQAGRNGIKILANGVTIDLQGFSVRGVPGSLDGITVIGIIDGVAVRNGFIRGFGASGLRLSEAASGLAHTVDNVAAIDNGGYGLFTAGAAVFRGCTAVRSGQAGFLANANGSTFESCTAHSNSGGGFVSGNATTFLNCAAVGNQGNGFTVGSDSAVTGCAARGNSSSGISMSSGGSITGCAAGGNGGRGILAQNACTIAGSSARENGGNGIEVGDRCTVRGNACYGNGTAGVAAGIRVVGSDNRVEGNNSTNNDYGIDVDGAGNFIMANTCSGNGTANWSVVAGNACFVVQAVASGAINGNSGGVSPGSANPFANFSY